MKKRYLVLFVENHVGVLTRITSLFVQRGFNIDSVTVSSTDMEGISRITVSSIGDEKSFKQLVSQTEKLIEVKKVICVAEEGAVLRELLLVKIEYWVVSTARVVNLYVEYVDNSKLGNIVDTIKNNNAYINDMEITKAASGHFCAVFTLKMRRRKAHQAMMTMIAKQDGVVSVEEL